MKASKKVFSSGLYPGTRPGDARDRAEAEELRQAGNVLYSSGDVSGAISKYSECLALDPTSHLAWGNRSTCWLRLNRAEEALDDAERAVSALTTYTRGYLRKGAAEWKLGRHADARATFELGLEVDPHDERIRHELARLVQRHETSLHAAARTAVVRSMVASPALDVEGLFELLHDLERITREAVVRQSAQLDALLDYLAKTLECDVVVLASSAALRDAYDRATFACGQLLSAAPGPASRLPNATRVVNALRHSLRCGWTMEPRAKSHGVSKFAANSLAVLACAPDADDGIRRLATRHLLHGMLSWLLDATAEPELMLDVNDASRRPRHDDPAGSDHASDDLPVGLSGDAAPISDDSGRRRSDNEQQLQRVVCGCGALCPRLSAPTWLERLFERGAPSWVRSECEAFVDAELLVMHLCIVVRDERMPPLGLPGLLRCVAARVVRSEIRIDLFVRADWRWDAAARVADDAASPTTTEPPREVAARPGETDAALARRLQAAFDDDAVRRTRNTDPPLPARRLGEWLAASLGYLILFVDGDELFSAHACAALERLATCSRDSADRISRGVWAGVPLLEKLSALACKDAHAVALLEALARRSHGSRTAMLSLAAALAGENTALVSPGAAAILPDVEAQHLAMAAPTADDNGNVHSEVDDDTETIWESAVPGIVVDDEGDDGAQATTPSFAEYYHELRGTLGTGSGTSEYSDDMVLLDSFATAANDLPVAGKLIVMVEGEEAPRAVVSVVPAAWNERPTDSFSSDKALCGDPSRVLGTAEWQASIVEGACALIERSAIRKSPQAPDWASAVQLCADAGATAAVVINDLVDDGAQRPAFRMGIFGAKPPPIAGFMVNGADGDRLRQLFPGCGADKHICVCCHIRVTTIRASNRGAASEETSVLRAAPAWPLRGVPRDVAQAWALAEVVASAAPTPELKATLSRLSTRMDAAEKRVWLARRLQRHHRSRAFLRAATDDEDDIAAADTLDDDPPLAFVECDRNAAQLPQLRRMLRDDVGLGASDITGHFEVRFKGESAAGSAVVRDWMDLIAHEAFIKGKGSLLCTKDHGRSFAPNPTALFVNPWWATDFELLGRLVGLVLWQQVTLDLPLHPVVCEALLVDGDLDALFKAKYADDASRPPLDVDLDLLKSIDPDLERSLRWIARADDPIDHLELSFTDALDVNDYDATEDTNDGETNLPLPAVGRDDDVVDPRDVWPAKLPTPGITDEELAPSRAETLAPGSRVELVPGGDRLAVRTSDRLTFVQLVLDWRLRKSLAGPIAAMAKGIRAAVPATVLVEARRMLTAADLVRLVSGLRDIDVDDWRRNTRLSGGLRPHANEVKWFWAAIKKWHAQDHKDRLHKCLQFATGSRRVPIGGFAHLVGLGGSRHLFTLAAGAHLPPGALPTAHACICTIDLPVFQSEQAAEAKLLEAIESGTLRFDEHAGMENDHHDA